MESTFATTFSELAAFDESDETDGWLEATVPVQHVFDGGVERPCIFRYRIRVWNQYGEFICRTLGNDPSRELYIGEVGFPHRPTNLQIHDMWEGGFEYSFDAVVPVGGNPEFLISILDLDWNQESGPYVTPVTASTSGTFTYYWIGGNYQVGRHYRMYVSLSNEGAPGTGNYTSVDFVFNPTVPPPPGAENPPDGNDPPGGNNPPPPPPPPGKCDLGFDVGIWVEWNASPQTWVPAYQTFYAYWIVGNFGGTSTGTYSDALYINGVFDSSVQWPSLAPGATALEVLDFSGGVAAGSMTIETFLDPNNQVDEVTNANNSSYHGITVGN